MKTHDVCQVAQNAVGSGQVGMTNARPRVTPQTQRLAKTVPPTMTAHCRRRDLLLNSLFNLDPTRLNELFNQAGRGARLSPAQDRTPPDLVFSGSRPELC